MSKMVEFKTVAPALSPEFVDLIDRCVELYKLDIVQGLAFEKEPQVFAAQGRATNPSKLGKIVAGRLRSLAPDTKRERGSYAANLPLQVLYDAEVRTLARRHNVDLSSGKPVMDQIDKARDFAFVGRDLGNERRLASLQDNLFDLQIGEPDATEATEEMQIRNLAPSLAMDPTVLRMLVERHRPMQVSESVLGALGGGVVAQPIVVNAGLKFRLHRVKCIDETNPEWPGDDEIAMGGTAVAANGSATKISEFRVGNDFDDGESKVYSPPRILRTFSLNNVNYPADFLMVLALAEKDNGGMSSFLQELWDAIKDDVQAIVVAVSASLGLAVGSAIGGSIGTAIGGPLGTIIGAVVGAVLGLLVGWLIAALKDDIFRPQTAAVRLPASNATFAGGALTSPQFTLNFRDHGGHYRAYYSWEITR